MSPKDFLAALGSRRDPDRPIAVNRVEDLLVEAYDEALFGHGMAEDGAHWFYEHSDGRVFKQHST